MLYCLFIGTIALGLAFINIFAIRSFLWVLGFVLIGLGLIGITLLYNRMENKYKKMKSKSDLLLRTIKKMKENTQQ